MLNTEVRESVLEDAVVTEAVHLIEEVGPLDDTEALREAMARRPDGPGRIVERARLLGHRLGLQRELDRARSWAPWVLLGLVALVVITGLSLAGGVVGGERREINVVVALVTLLGLHLLTLALWLLGLVLPLGSVQASFGWLWMTLTARVAGGQRGQAPVLMRAAMRLLGRARLLPWSLGFVSHAVWSLSFAVILAALLFSLAFRNYTLSWETTILEPDFFVRGVQVLGWLPGWLGFPVPDAETVRAASAASAVSAGQRDWALWLTGCILVYGLLPRVLLAAWSAGMWQVRKKAIRPDLSQPGYRKLLARFDAMAPRQIVDADSGSAAERAPHGLAAGDTTDALVLIGFELPDEIAWPPPSLDVRAATVLNIDGSGAARRDVLDRLVRQRPRHVVVACNAASTPDRGTARFLREVASHSGDCRLWLLSGETVGASVGASVGDQDAGDRAAANRSAHREDGASAHREDGASARWRSWLADAGLATITTVHTAEGALAGSEPAA
ncbi:MAG: DUF2868 domain-containing protein [Gammaproteobacteria bacterium]|nr:DUF2868 domain-containing protein [Gammaproteobacteria bacterium]